MNRRQEEDRADDYASAPTLRGRGWTDAMVRDLLGEPDTTRRNPVYRAASPMRLWLRARVEHVEQSDTFARRRRQAEARSKSGTAAAQRKREQLIAQVEAEPVPVPQLPLSQIRRDAIAHFNARGALRDHGDRATEDSDPDFLDRITVNYLRHELSDYEARLTGLFGQVGRAEATTVVREQVYGAIADTYPDLAMECDRQADERQRNQAGAGH